MSKSRLESFSDGVIAVAITLLVLGVAVPKPSGSRTLATALLHQWPAYAAYVVSFVTIGIIWINHHAVVSRLDRADHAILLLNLLLLLCIGVVPFATSLMATYLKEGRGQSLAAGVYAGTFLVLTVVFFTLNWHILFRKVHMLGVELTGAERRNIVSRGFTGVLPYAVATAVAPLSAYATLGICAAIAMFYASPLATGGARRQGSSGS
ncbi:MAG: DUF1211 domain-containing protein [Acidimicrobiaceae bacterium]|nr:DUF1211 domain-containing protein [Acidimicrobiaceae bacterium]